MLKAKKAGRVRVKVRVIKLGSFKTYSQGVTPLTISLGILALTLGCGLKKVDSAADNSHGEGRSEPGSLSELQIRPEDWEIQNSLAGKARILRKTLKVEKTLQVRKQFRVPTLSSITVPESAGFELYEIHGYPELESAAYVHPKVFIASSDAQGSILGYRTGKSDARGAPIVEVSLPVALVNGAVVSIPTVGSPMNGSGSAVLLPEKYQIGNSAALKARLGKEIKTLPICPTLFKLKFEGHEYWAESPFSHLSDCPLNQFFRIQFQAPVEEMRRMLEGAALRDEAVTLDTDFSLQLTIPQEVVEVTLASNDVHAALQKELALREAEEEEKGQESSQTPAYALSQIENAVSSVFFKLSQDAGLTPQVSGSLLSAVDQVILNSFSNPLSCGAAVSCRTLLPKPKSSSSVSFTWMKSESVTQAIQTRTTTGLGAVANSSEFVAKPARDQLAAMRRPPYFSSREFSDIVRECGELSAMHFPLNPGKTEEEKKYFESYCRAIAINGIRNDGDPNQADGYFPLGSNTVVYPGAWIRLDINEVSELTTAKTKLLNDGTLRLESEVVDLLATDPTAKRTQCVESKAIACAEYKTKDIPVRDSKGDQIHADRPCKKGEPDCSCSVPQDSNGHSTGSDEVCLKKQALFQNVRDFECSPKDAFEYCPYWREQNVHLGNKLTTECADVKVKEISSILCLGGCYSETRRQCDTKIGDPIYAVQMVNICPIDANGKQILESGCRAPKYKCARWTENCTRYSVNEAFQVVHEEVAPKWRPFAIQKGEYPKRFEEDIYLKFVSPGKTVKNCRLDRFAREFRGNSIYIHLPNEKNEGQAPCDEPLWDERNTKSQYLPKVYLKNAISYPEQRLCGRTEYSFLTQDIPRTAGDELVPPQYTLKTQAHIGPVREACRAESPFQVGVDLWFTETPPVRFSGRVSVLGRVLESIVMEPRS